MMMMKWPVAVLLLYLFIQAEGRLCKRSGCYCQNNRVPTGNMCECGTGHYGYDCGLATSNLCHTNLCKNGGVCHDNNKCYCHPDYFGDICQFETTPVNCGMDSMQVGFAIPKDQAVRIFAAANEACEFRRVSESYGHAIYMLEVNLTTTRSVPCMNVITESRQGDMTTYAIDGYVAEDIELYTPKDWAVTFECTYTSVGTPSQRDVTAESSDILFAFTDVNGTLVDNIAKYQPFDIVFFLRPNSTYLNLHLNKLVVYNQNSNVKMFTLIEAGEINYISEKWNLYRDLGPEKTAQTQFEFEVAENVTVPAVKVKVTGLPDQASIYVDYDIRVCQTLQCRSNTFSRQGGEFFDLHGTRGL
ncbi:gigasin-2-like [Mizuhopecten yessoensis]|uniref:EGF-like domain-containing protein 2 n=1 Tax=Mizuhopecten yessoensis TaxID=6573 RepID=A0A210QCB8_MIZYE|nr:gigasin-2-like [Mizuhopecten yessoensis]OWF46350.1 EGF-like domain-containing protein 2 [Mizuhopecten yessoensis]